MNKKQKNILAIAFILLFTSNVAAQNNMTINIGYVNTTNIARWSSKILNIELDYSDEITLNGITAGFEYDMLLGNVIGLNLGLGYIYSFRDKTLIGGDNFTGQKYHYHTLEAPARLALSLPLGRDFKILLYGGPKFTFDMIGIYQNYLNGKKTDSAKNLYAKENYRSRFNVALGPAAGLRYKNIMLKLGYDFGLININTNDISANILNKDKLKIIKEQWYVKLGLAF